VNYDARFNGLGRDALERVATTAIELAERRERDVEHLTRHLTDVQTRCTELLLENRKLRSGLILDGWWCPCAATDKSRGIFNSDAKEKLPHCRSCGAPRPT